MTLLEQLKAAFFSKAKKSPQRNTGAETRRKNHQDRYKKVFDGRQLTTAQVAELAFITPMGCINILRRFEELGLVRRVGKRQTGGTNPTIVWEWK